MLAKILTILSSVVSVYALKCQRVAKTSTAISSALVASVIDHSAARPPQVEVATDLDRLMIAAEVDAAPEDRDPVPEVGAAEVAMRAAAPSTTNPLTRSMARRPNPSGVLKSTI